MRKGQLKVLVLALMVALVVGLMPAQISLAAAKPKLSKSKVVVKVGKRVSIKLKKNKQKATWKVVSGKKNIALKAQSKKGVTIVGKKAGVAKVQVRIGKVTLTCKVVVKKAAKKPVKDDADDDDDDYDEDDDEEYDDEEYDEDDEEYDEDDEYDDEEYDEDDEY